MLKKCLGLQGAAGHDSDTGGDSGKGIDLGEAVAFLMAAVKAQAKEIKGLKQDISRLKGNL